MSDAQKRLDSIILYAKELRLTAKHREGELVDDVGEVIGDIVDHIELLAWGPRLVKP